MFYILLYPGTLPDDHFVPHESDGGSPRPIFPCGWNQSGFFFFFFGRLHRWEAWNFVREWISVQSAWFIIPWSKSHASLTVLNTSSSLPSYFQTWSTTSAWKFSASTTENGFLRNGGLGIWWTWLTSMFSDTVAHPMELNSALFPLPWITHALKYFGITIYSQQFDMNYSILFHLLYQYFTVP